MPQQQSPVYTNGALLILRLFGRAAAPSYSPLLRGGARGGAVGLSAAPYGRPRFAGLRFAHCYHPSRYTPNSKHSGCLTIIVTTSLTLGFYASIRRKRG